MYVKKIIRGYFAFIMALTVAGGLSYNDYISDTVGDTYLSIVHGLDTVFDETMAEIDDPLKTIENSKNIYQANVFSADANEDSAKLEMNQDIGLITATISNDPAKAYTKSGYQDVEMMIIEFTSKDDFTLEELKLKIDGIEDTELDQVSLKVSEAEMDGVPSDGYWRFHKIKANSEEGKLSVKVIVDMGENLGPNDRFKFDIETVEDAKFSIKKGGKARLTSAVKGVYLTVVK